MGMFINMWHAQEIESHAAKAGEYWDECRGRSAKHLAAVGGYAVLDYVQFAGLAKMGQALNAVGSAQTGVRNSLTLGKYSAKNDIISLNRSSIRQYANSTGQHWREVLHKTAYHEGFHRGFYKHVGQYLNRCAGRDLYETSRFWRVTEETLADAWGFMRSLF